MVTRRPRAFRIAPSDDAAIPLPSDETTPPVKKMNLVRELVVEDKGSSKTKQVEGGQECQPLFIHADVHVRIGEILKTSGRRRPLEKKECLTQYGFISFKYFCQFFGNLIKFSSRRFPKMTNRKVSLSVFDF